MGYFVTHQVVGYRRVAKGMPTARYHSFHDERGAKILFERK